MSKKLILTFSFATIVFFLLFVKSWDKDYYFPVIVLIVYFFSIFIKSGIVKYYSTICILALFVIIQDSWLIDYFIPILLVVIIIGDVLFQFINLIQAKFFKKFEYTLVKLLTPIFPILVTIILLTIETNNLDKTKSNLSLTYSNLLKRCETTDLCSDKVWKKKQITTGITTLQLSYVFKNNCLFVNPSKNWVNIKYYNSCNKDS